MKNATPYTITLCGINFDPTTFTSAAQFGRFVWGVIFAETENEEWANDSEFKAMREFS